MVLIGSISIGLAEWGWYNTPWPRKEGGDAFKMFLPLQNLPLRPWPNDLIIHSTFLSTFQLLIFPQSISARNIYHYQYLLASETLLRMFSLDFLDKVAQRVNFHSTTTLLLDFFDKDQTSLNITRFHSTLSTRWRNSSILPSIFCQVKNWVVWSEPKVSMI